MFGFQSFYTLLFLFLFLYVSALKGATHNNIKKVCVWTYALLFVIAGFRGLTVGGDLDNYLPEFEMVSRSHGFLGALKTGWHEPGYVIYLKLVSLVSSDPHFFLIMTALISLIGPFCLFKKYSRDVVTSILLYYAMGAYTNTFNNLRQSLALSIFFMTLPYLFNRKLYKYLLGVVLATTFHYSAFSMLILYPLTRKPLGLKQTLIYAGSGFVISYVFFYRLLGTASQMVLAKYDPDVIMENADGSGYGLFAFHTLIFAAVFIFYFVNKRRWNGVTEQTMSTFLTFQMATMIIQFTAPMFHSMTRMTQYLFIPFYTIAIPYIHSVIKNLMMKKCLYIVSFAYALYRMVFQIYACNPLIGSNNQNNIPYIFWDIVIF